MGYLKLLVMKDFKSWRGEQIIGPFMRFNCVIGPNGSGKSNIMDAVSFVMCEKISNLRVKSVRELIHGAHVGKPVSSTASVKIIYCEEDGEEKTFSRVIRGSCSEFFFNDRSVSRSTYVSELEKLGILVKARNFLIFQGTVESIAMKKPRERTQLFEQISNSWEYAEDYERKKKKMQQAEEDVQFHYNKKKSVAAERKQAKIEKEEAEHYQMLLKELDEERIQLKLFRLYHNEKHIDFQKRSLDEKNMEASIKKDSLSTAEDAFRAKKKVLGVLNRDQQQMEKEMKTLEASVVQQRALYIKAKENTAYQIKKVEMSKKSLRDKEKSCDKEKQNIKELEMELNDIEKAWRAFEKKTEEEILQRAALIELGKNQLERYKELKETARKKTATLTQQLEKLRWEEKGDQERLKLNRRKKKEVEENIKHTVEQIEEHKKRIEKLEEYAKICTYSFRERSAVPTTTEMEQKIFREHVQQRILSFICGGVISIYGKTDLIIWTLECKKSSSYSFRATKFGRLLLCHPIHKKYQLAVTKVFSKYMTAIIVATEKTARDCIRFLKQERAEPETFLALDYLDVKPINEKLREIKGAKLMVDVVQTPFPQVKKVIQFVSGNGLICETVKEAKQIAFDGPVRLKVRS
ncbi:SMC1B protein, partial [Lophotis ruficrista]|nr:SMC1B protein [Lophotis ruficrista]